MTADGASVAVVAAEMDPRAPTPPLDDFLVAYADDDNWWWRLSSGHHQNLFDEAVERMATAEYHVATGRLRYPEDFA